MKLIPLSNGLAAMVDDSDYDLVMALGAKQWHAKRFPNCSTWYAYAYIRADGRPKMILLHRLILGITDRRVFVDHVDGYGLDCRRENLRRATPAQNQANRRKQAGTLSPYKGVSMIAGRWVASIQINRKKIALGRYDSPEAAARAYDQAARAAWGEFALLNFPA